MRSELNKAPKEWQKADFLVSCHHIPIKHHEKLKVLPSITQELYKFLIHCCHFGQILIKNYTLGKIYVHNNIVYLDILIYTYIPIPSIFQQETITWSITDLQEIWIFHYSSNKVTRKRDKYICFYKQNSKTEKKKGLILN